MKKYLSLVLTLLCTALACGSGRAQAAEDYFIVGTLRDYMGRGQYIDPEKFQIDYYSDYEKALAKYVVGLIDGRYGPGSTTMDTMRGICNLYSQKAYGAVDKVYYAINPTAIRPQAKKPKVMAGGDTIWYRENLRIIPAGSTEFNEILSDKRDTIPAYKLNANSFTTDDQMMAYMHGVFLRHGGIVNDTLYYIKAYNSSTGRIFETLAGKQGFRNVAREDFRGIPGSTTVAFSPSSEFLEFISRTASLKEELDSAYRQELKRLGEKYYTMFVEGFPASIIELAKKAKNDNIK